MTGWRQPACLSPTPTSRVSAGGAWRRAAAPHCPASLQRSPPPAHPPPPPPAVAPALKDACGEELLQDTDLWGADLADGEVEAESPQGCCDACAARPDCGAFTYVPDWQMCYLKGAAGFNQTDGPGSVSWVAGAASVEPAPAPAQPQGGAPAPAPATADDAAPSDAALPAPAPAADAAPALALAPAADVLTAPAAATETLPDNTTAATETSPEDATEALPATEEEPALGFTHQSACFG